MPNTIRYRVIVDFPYDQSGGPVSPLEAALNKAAGEGWRAVTAAEHNTQVVVILSREENPQKAA